MKRWFLFISLAVSLIVGFSACKTSSSDDSGDASSGGSSGSAGTITVAAPTIAVSGSGIARSVTLSATSSGATIYYTLDGTTPTTSSLTYGSAITVAGYYVSRTITAIAVVSSTSSTASSKTVSITPSATLSLNATPAISTVASDLSSYSPLGIASDGTTLFVSQYSNAPIKKIAISSGTVSDLTGTSPGFNRANRIATDGSFLYVSDWGNQAIYRVAIASGKVTTLVAAGTLSSPQGITTDGSCLYIVDPLNSKILKVQ